IKRLALLFVTLVAAAKGMSEAVSDSSTAAANKSTAAWIYQSDSYGFSMTLPDTGWIERPSSVHGVVGFIKKGYAMRTDVFVVDCESDKAFEELTGRVKHQMDSAPGISGTQHESGKSSSGHRYQFSLGTEKNKAAPSGIFLGQSVVWIENRKVAIRVCFQGES